MTLFMDVHSLGDAVSLDDVAKAHGADLETQDAYGVHYMRYWVSEDEGRSSTPATATSPAPRQARACLPVPAHGPDQGTRHPHASA